VNWSEGQSFSAIYGSADAISGMHGDLSGEMKWKRAAPIAEQPLFRSLGRAGAALRVSGRLLRVQRGAPAQAEISAQSLRAREFLPLFQRYNLLFRCHLLFLHLRFEIARVGDTQD
jgi:hypothetical protein